MPLREYTSKQVSGLPGGTYGRSPLFVLALCTGDRQSGAEYSKGMERLSLPVPKKWGLGQAEVSEPLWSWCRPHSVSAPSSNAAHMGQLPAQGHGSEVWAGSVLCSLVPASPAVRAGSSAPDFPSLCLHRSNPQSVIEYRLPPALLCARTASRLRSDHSTALVPANTSLPARRSPLRLGTFCIISWSSEDEEGGAR